QRAALQHPTAPSVEGGGSEDGLEDRVTALYDELFCTGKHLHAKVPIDPKAIIRRALATPNPIRAEQPEGKGAVYFSVTVKDGDWTSTFEEWQAKYRRSAPAAPVVVDEAMVERAKS